MRLSDAIALGRHLLKPEPYNVIQGDYGCAIGMAFAAIGAKSTKEAVAKCKVNPEWHWLGKTKPVTAPCSCDPEDDQVLALKSDYRGWIAHLFNEHVCYGVEPAWTLDQLIDWVRSVEPQEEPVSDPEAEYYEQRAGLNEPPPEEPELEDLGREGSAREKTGAHIETASASLPDKVGQAFIEETNRRVRLNSWAGAKLAIDELRNNGDVKL